MHTGDVGHLDEDGFLVITDRKKDIIVTAGGKNVAPQNLENELKAQRAISQAVVVGDRKPYIAALITLDPEARAPTLPRCSARSMRSTRSGHATSRSSASPSSRASSRSRTARSRPR